MWPFLVSARARPGPPARHIVITLLQTAAMWAVFLFIAPAIIVRMENLLGLSRFHFAIPAQHAIAATVFVMCGSAGIVSGLDMARHGEGTPLPATGTNRLIVIGLYRYVRNPMAMSSLAQGLCVAIWLGSPFVLAYVLAGSLLWNFVARPWEEADLARRFGEPYQEYRRAVRCWIPRLSPYSPGSRTFEAITAQNRHNIEN